MIFVDSSCWFALAFAGDRHHGRAKTLVEHSPDQLLTSDHVSVETWLLVNSRFNFHYAQTFWTTWPQTGVQIEFACEHDFATAGAIATRYPDQTFSIVDRTSLAIMERLGITRAVSFDDDFVIYRYGIDRTRAFEVLR